MSTMTALPEHRTDDDAGAFDFPARVDELRCHPNQVLREHVALARREQERWRLEELAALRVLDDRMAVDRMLDAGVSARTTKVRVEAARALETMPALAAQAHDGNLSWEQLEPLTRIATPETEAEWSERGPRIAPIDLQRIARKARRVTVEEAQARVEARLVTTWREPEDGMAAGRWRLPDVDGVLVDKVLEHMAERMRPPKGGTWDTLAHRKADALVELARSFADAEPTGRFRIEIVNQITPGATEPAAEIEGIALAPETVDALIPGAKTRAVTLDDHGVPVTTGKARPALLADVEQHVRRRDLHCRVPGCTASRRLEIHHLRPRSMGGTDYVTNLAGVCPAHHRLLVPIGPYWLVGDPGRPDGLRLVHRDDLPPDGPSP